MACAGSPASAPFGADRLSSHRWRRAQCCAFLAHGVARHAIPNPWVFSAPRPELQQLAARVCRGLESEVVSEVPRVMTAASEGSSGPSISSLELEVQPVRRCRLHRRRGSRPWRLSCDVPRGTFRSSAREGLTFAAGRRRPRGASAQWLADRAPTGASASRRTWCGSFQARG